MTRLLNNKDELYPSLGLFVYAKATGIEEFTITDKYLYGKNDQFNLKMPIINNNGIVYSHIAYYKTPDGVYSHQNISASDVIESLRNLQKGEKPIINPEIF